MINIITGSTLGGAEYLADHIYDLLLPHQHPTRILTIHNQPILDDIPQQGIWLLITSTYGAGTFPDNIQPFINTLTNTTPDLSQVKFAIIALGDRSYDTFCQAGKLAYSLLISLNAIPICSNNCLFIDVTATESTEDVAEKWLNQHLELFI